MLIMFIYDAKTSTTYIVVEQVHVLKTEGPTLGFKGVFWAVVSSLLELQHSLLCEFTALLCKGFGFCQTSQRSGLIFVGGKSWKYHFCGYTSIKMSSSLWVISLGLTLQTLDGH